MVKRKNKNHHDKENTQRQRTNKYKEGTSLTNISISTIFLKILLVIIFFNSISLTKEKLLEIITLDHSSTIMMKINGGGDKYIFSPYFDNFSSIDKVFIDGTEVTSNPNGPYNLNAGKVNVTVIFKDTITSCFHMFYAMKDLLEIDLSNFESSSINNMVSMFNGCKSLTSINFLNFDTSNVTRMHAMFYGCRNLTSLDISNFNTNKVKDMS